MELLGMKEKGKLNVQEVGGNIGARRLRDSVKVLPLFKVRNRQGHLRVSDSDFESGL